MASVYIFNATPDDIDPTLNGGSLDQISGTEQSKGYQPDFLPVQRYVGKGKSGTFGDSNTLKISYSGTSPTKQYQINISSPLSSEADLQLYVFYDTAVLIGPDHDTPSLVVKAQPVPGEG